MRVHSHRGLSSPVYKIVSILLATALWLAGCTLPALPEPIRPSMPPAGTATVRLAEQVPQIIHDGIPLAATESAANPHQSMLLTLTLRRADEAGFQHYLAGVQNPASSTYRHYLSQAELADRFGPSLSTYTTVQSWLQSQGFEVVQESTNRLTLSVRGTRQLVEQAFDLHLRDYRIGGQTFYANQENPALPAAIAAQVHSISGLSNLAQPKLPVSKERIRNDCNYQQIPEFYFFGLQFGYLILVNVNITLFYQAWMFGNCLGEVANYYSRSGGTSPFDNAAQTSAAADPTRSAAASAQQKIGLLEFDTFHRSDVEDWLRATYAGPTSRMAQLSEVQVNGGVATPGGGETEVLLDIGVVMLLAPSAQYVVYSAPLDTSYEQLFNAMIDDEVTIISNSWSSCENQFSRAQVESINSVLAQAAAGGISVFNGSGDSGSTCLNGSPNTVGVPANSPNATAVGGTTPKFGPALTYAGESWWGDGEQNPPTGEGGFGVSRYFARPAYQDGWTNSTTRSVPDIAIVADPSAGMTLCQASAGGCPTGKVYGGTSMAAPAMAALTAVLNERVGANLGFANPIFYELAKDHPDTFHSAAGMSSDFAHVGLGSPDLNRIEAFLKNYTIGPAHPSRSLSVASLNPPADGVTKALVRVNLRDAQGFPVTGKTVTLTPNVGSHAVIGPASGPSDATTGAVVFEITNEISETVTLLVTDVTDNVVLERPQVINFVPPPATSGSIAANPATATADGLDAVNVVVTLQNAKGQPAAGKTIALSVGSAHALITPSGNPPGVTDLTGTASFTVTNLTSETVTFSATDITDGNLLVPGTAQATFTAAGPTPCPAASPIAADDYAFSTFATGYANGDLFYLGKYYLAKCGGPAIAAFDAAGNLWVPNLITGDIFKFGRGGGVAAGPNKVTATPLGPWLFALAFGKEGTLYALQTFVNNTESGEIYEINPATGAISRTVATNLHYGCPLAVDPLSGDLFTADCWSGFAASPHLLRIHDPGPGQPPVDCNAPTTTSEGCSIYASPGSADNLTFDADGTLYVRGAGSAGVGANIWSVSGTNTSAPPTVTLLDASVPGGSGIAILRRGTNEQKPLVAVYNSTLDRIDALDLNQPAPRTSIPLVSETSAGGGVGVQAMGPDGCLYANLSNSTIRVTNADGTCPFAPASTQPAITLTASRHAAPTGESIVYTATLVAWPNAEGTPVNFNVAGANPQIKHLHADVNGRATFTQTGVLTGTDQVIANATIVSTTRFSQIESVIWSAGKHVTFAALNLAPTSATVSATVSLQASLTDMSVDPPQPIGGAALTLGLGERTCQVVTDAGGIGACTLAAGATPGAGRLTVTFAGTDLYMPSRNQQLFIVTNAPVYGVWLPEIYSQIGTSAWDE